MKLADSDTHDRINSPKHYTAGGIETIDFMRAKLSPEQFEGYLLGTAIKYLSRARFKKQKKDDYKKAKWFVDKLVEVFG